MIWFRLMDRALLSDYRLERFTFLFNKRHRQFFFQDLTLNIKIILQRTKKDLIFLLHYLQIYKKFNNKLSSGNGFVVYN